MTHKYHKWLWLVNFSPTSLPPLQPPGLPLHHPPNVTVPQLEVQEVVRIANEWVLFYAGAHDPGGPAARSLPQGRCSWLLDRFPLFSRGSVCPACLSALQVRKALDLCSSEQNQASVLHNVLDAAAGLPTFVPGIRCIPTANS